MARITAPTRTGTVHSPWSRPSALAADIRLEGGDINRRLVGLFSLAVACEHRAEWVSDTTDELVGLADRDRSNEELADQLILELRDAIEIEVRKKIAAQIMDGDMLNEPLTDHAC